MTKTYREIIDFINFSANYLRAHPQENKLKYALTKVSKKAMKSWESYNDKLEDLRIDNCAVDSEGVIIRDERQNYRFSKDGLKKFNLAQRELAAQSTTIEPFIASEAPYLTESERESFDGYVVGPDTKIAEAAKTPSEPTPS